MRCKMKAVIMDMCILSHNTQCFSMFGHMVEVGASQPQVMFGYATNWDVPISQVCQVTVSIAEHLAVSGVLKIWPQPSEKSVGQLSH